MAEAPASPPLKLGGKRSPAPRGARPIPPTVWSSETAQPIEIVAPDRSCTALLLEYARPLFPAELVPGSTWTVRLQPPAGGAWVVEFLSLVERWLDAARLPCTTGLYCGRSYLIRTTPVAAFGPATAHRWLPRRHR